MSDLAEAIRKSAIGAGCEEVWVCSGCGEEGCDSCPCGSAKILKNSRALQSEAKLKSIREAMEEFSLTGNIPVRIIREILEGKA